ncbi:MAG: hypothetical protein SFY66_19710 [Oculatellaceae cyanobacterium bins.114]|nr:hypothetical protein [Oculatellaceae cyanobacterium bins.114]
MFNLLSELWQTDDKGEFKRKTYAAHLLRSGYAVTLSNHVDPLAASNWFQALPLIETLQEMGIPLNLMTRFGKDEHTQELFSLLKQPTPIYVSVPTLNAEIARKCEPGAPLPEQRLEYIKQAIALGHPVNVGINPVIPGWIDDRDLMAKTFKEIGVWGVCLGKIHLSKDQIANMSEREQKNLGDRAIEAASRRHKDPELNELYKAVEAACDKYGLHIYTAQQGRYSKFFEHEKRLASKGFPLMQEFVNHCHKTKKSGDLVVWGEFHDFFAPHLPKGVWNLREHVNSTTRIRVLNEKKVPQRMDYSQLLWHGWQYTEIGFCPANVDCFAWAGDPLDAKKNVWTTLLDDLDLPILVFKPEGTNGQAFTKEHKL